jgi:outer membrane immunogenic protein
MKNNILMGLAVLTFTAGALPALAGGLAEPVMEPAPVAIAPAPVTPVAGGWNGLYVGGQIGTIKVDSSIPANEFMPGTDFPNELVDFELDGTTYGLHIGYMQGFGAFVLGAELDYDVVRLDDGSVTFMGETADIVIENDGSILRLKARAGYDAGRFLPYLTAGVARLELEDQNTDGGFYGAGLAFKATETILIGGEVLQHQFKDSFETGVDLDATTFSLRASYRF